MRITTALLALPFLLLSGCFGGGGSPATATDDATKVVAPPTTSASPLSTIDPANVPKYHPHDLWGDRTTVLIFDSTVSLGQDVSRESYYREGVVVSGYAQFDPRTDGDDSESIDKADVVYQGTKALVVKVEWTEEPGQAQIPGLSFLYKPANSARFMAVENVQNGAEVYIPLSKGWADMPHQMKLSRWRFALEAFDPAFNGMPAKAFAARGPAHVLIHAVNGGEKSIDPPHPYNFLESNLRPAGEITRTIDNVEVSAADYHARQGDQGRWQVDPPFIIPWETTKVHAKLYYNYTGPATAATHELVLGYTDASGLEGKTAQAAATGPGYAYFEIPVQANQADDPYATHSDWTWSVHPFVNGQESATEFAGEIHLVLVAEGTNEVTE